MSEVKSIDIGKRCMESYPCQHNCKITYSDGIVEPCQMDGRSIIREFWGILSEEDKEHFRYLLPVTRMGEKRKRNSTMY